MRLVVRATKMAESTIRSRCIFCKIIDGVEKSDMIYQNDDVCVFRDVRPAAKNHLLSVSKRHIKDAKCLTAEDKPLLEQLIEAAKEALTKVNGDLNDVRYGFHWPPFHSVSHLHLHAISPASEMGFVSRMIFKENSYWFVPPDYVLSRL